MTSRTTTENFEDQIDTESFIKAEESATAEDMEGLVILNKVEHVESMANLPPEAANITARPQTEFFIFEAQDVRNDSDVKLIVRDDDYYDDMNRLLEWTDSTSISSLAGSTAPVVPINGDSGYYTFPKFQSCDYIDDDIESVREAYEMGVIEFDGEKWVKSEKMKQHEDKMSKIESYASTGFWVAIGLSFFVPYDPISTLLTVTAIVMIGTEIYMDKRKKPIKFLFD